MVYEVILGIDPGVNGAISAISGDEVIEVIPCPKLIVGRKSDYDITGMVAFIMRYKDKKLICYLEQVHAMPKQGVTSMFSFGKGFGIWIGILAALQIPYEFVSPQHWKNKLLQGTDKSKGAAIKVCKQLYPTVDLKPGRKVTDHDGMAEAILIASYGGMRRWA